MKIAGPEGSMMVVERVLDDVGLPASRARFEQVDPVPANALFERQDLLEARATVGTDGAANVPLADGGLGPFIIRFLEADPPQIPRLG